MYYIAESTTTDPALVPFIPIYISLYNYTNTVELNKGHIKVEHLIMDTLNKGRLSIKDTSFNPVLILKCIIQSQNM